MTLKDRKNIDFQKYKIKFFKKKAKNKKILETHWIDISYENHIWTKDENSLKLDNCVKKYEILDILDPIFIIHVSDIRISFSSASYMPLLAVLLF